MFKNVAISANGKQVTVARSEWDAAARAVEKVLRKSKPAKVPKQVRNAQRELENHKLAACPNVAVVVADILHGTPSIDGEGPGDRYQRAVALLADADCELRDWQKRQTRRLSAAWDLDLGVAAEAKEKASRTRTSAVVARARQIEAHRRTAAQPARTQRTGAEAWRQAVREMDAADAHRAEQVAFGISRGARSVEFRDDGGVNLTYRRPGA